MVIVPKGLEVCENNEKSGKDWEKNAET